MGSRGCTSGAWKLGRDSLGWTLLRRGARKPLPDAIAHSCRHLSGLRDSCTVNPLNTCLLSGIRVGSHLSIKEMPKSVIPIVMA